MLLTGLRLPGQPAPSSLRTDGVVFADADDAVTGERVVDLAGSIALPGLLDLHVHGGGGHDVTRSADDLAAAVAFHNGRGTAATLVSLVTAPVDALCEQLGWIADRCESPQAGGTVLGAHLEGPFLSHARCGAQNPDHLLLPDRDVLAELIAAGRGHLRCVTIAPELPGALTLVDDLVVAGVVVAIGHTDATYDEACAAVDHGATLATHVFNGMRPLHHREPGAVGAALDRGLACELINDGAHLHRAAARLVRDVADPVLITDAMDAAGMGDGRYTLGGQEVVVSGAEARLAANGSLAGSTLTLDAAAGRALRDGWTVEDVAAATSATPARVLGLGDRFGSFAPGRRADAVVLDADGTLRGALSAGEWREPA